MRKGGLVRVEEGGRGGGGGGGWECFGGGKGSSEVASLDTFVWPHGPRATKIGGWEMCSEPFKSREIDGLESWRRTQGRGGGEGESGPWY